MTKFLKIFIFFVISLTLTNCSRILQTVDLEINTEDNSIQEEFNVIEKTLTIKEARQQNKSAYKRLVLQSGRGNNAQNIPESLAIQSNFPEKSNVVDYKIGVGDALTFSKLIENNRAHLDVSTTWPKDLGTINYRLGIGDNLGLTLLKEEETIETMEASDSRQNQTYFIESQNDIVLETKGRIGSDGSVLLLEVGRLEAEGKTLNELQTEVRNILIRNGLSPRFQLEIIEFKSQKAYLTINEASTAILLYDQKTTLRDILTSAAVGFKPGIITRVRLQRNGKEYQMTLRSIFGKNAPEINIYTHDHIFVEDSSANLISSVSNVGHDGHVVFAGIGRIRVVDRTLDDIRAEIASIIAKVPDAENAFQIEITKFASQSALVNIPGKSGGIIPINDTSVALDEVLTENGLSVDGNSIVRINLQRQGKSYEFTLYDLLKKTTKRIYLQPSDRVMTETLSYKENKVFILGGVQPQIFKINPENRETLADILFTDGGVLSSSDAKRSEVYLLRGTNPVLAYHLDAQNPTRLIVADAMELRPNDILYVAEQPIVSFNRTLSAIAPLRILLSDIQDNNIP